MFLDVLAFLIKCIPKESEMLSAKAMISMPPIMLAFALTLEWNPTIRPRFVIIAADEPKLNFVRLPLIFAAAFLKTIICDDYTIFPAMLELQLFSISAGVTFLLTPVLRAWPRLL